MEEIWRTHGDPQCQKSARRALSQAQGAREAGAPLRGPGSDDAAERGPRGAARAFDPRIARSRQGSVDPRLCGRVHRARARFVGLLDDLGSGPVALDTSIFVYLIEEDPRFLGAVLPVFSAASEGRYGLVASTLT